MKITELKAEMPIMPVREDRPTDATLDSIVERYPTELESVLTGNSFLYDHDKFYDELYEYFVTGAGRGEMPYGVAKARDGDPDQWITEYLEQEYGREYGLGHSDPESMDGDFDSAMASAGHGTDEDYGHYGETSGNQMRKYADIISESSKKKEKVTATRMPMQAPFKVVEGHTGPTRMEVQKYFNKQEGLLRAKINATEKAFNIHDLKIDSKGQVVSFEQ